MAEVAVHALTKRFGDTAAVKDVSIVIGASEFVTLLGPSGCGKTTLLRAIAGLVAPDAGAVHIDGLDITALEPHRRELAMVFQSPALFPHMTVARNVAFGLRMRNVAERETAGRVVEALAMMRLDGFEQRYPRELSGGQQQRVAIARALVVRPRVLLMDEPFSALDRKLREAMQLELRELTRQLGITVIFVTHDQEEALVLSDRIAVMDAGRIVQAGAPSQVFERPRTRFVADFMGFGNVLTGKVVDGVSVAVEQLRFELERGRLDADRSQHEMERPRQTQAVPGTDGPVHIGLRAERIEIVPFDAAILRGLVTRAVYQGGISTLTIKPASAGPSLLVRTPHRTFAVGDEVGLRWRIEDVCVLATDQQA